LFFGLAVLWLPATMDASLLLLPAALPRLCVLLMPLLPLALHVVIAVAAVVRLSSLRCHGCSCRLFHFSKY